MTVKNKKIFLTTALFMTLAVLLALMGSALFSYAHVSARTGEEAFAADLAWTPYVKLHNRGGSTDPVDDYTTIVQPMDLTDGDTIAYVIRIADSAIFNGSTFKYCLSDTELSGADLSAYMRNNSHTINSGSYASLDKIEDGKTVRYLWITEDPNTDFRGYVYFRREYTVNEGGQSRIAYEPYPEGIQIIYNYSDASTQPEITRVTATMANGAPYDGTWLSGALRFTIVTAAMNPTEENPGGTTAFDSNRELLYYSVDKNHVNFTRVLSGNVVEIKGLLLDERKVVFRVTNISGELVSEYEYGDHTENNEHPVCMDPYKPYFTVTAMTLDNNDNVISYPSGTWTSKAVTFRIEDNSDCYKGTNGERAIKYYISKSGEEFKETDLTETVESTMQSVQFRAISVAGVVYDYNTVFKVNIDAVTPNIYVSASTPDPESSTEWKTLPSSTKTYLVNEDTGETASYLDFGYANGDIRVNIFNRDASGAKKNNESGTIFEYQMQRASGYSGTWLSLDKTVTGKDRNNAEDIGYLIEDSAQSTVSVSRRYKFRIRSNAGLVSDEVEIVFVMIKSSYLIELGEISAELNEYGWIKDKAEVWVSVPTDSKRQGNGEYSTPTIKYWFRYKPTNSEDDTWYYDFTNPGDSDAENPYMGIPVKFHEEVDNEVRWWYKFSIMASADSTFVIEAYNAAMKKSANSVTTEEKIRIDVLDPVYSLRAFIEPVDASTSELIELRDVNDPGWVNGQIRLLLRVKNGVSGVYVKELIYTEENGEIVKDTAGNIIWQPRNQTMQGNRTEEGTAVWYEYPIIINPSDNKKEYVGTTQYKYRIYTNSGKYVDVGFTANIDTSEIIAVKDMTFVSGGKTQKVNVRGTAGSGFIDMSDSEYNFSVCEDTNIYFTSTLDKASIEDHYRIRYQLFDGSSIATDRLLAYAAGLDRSNYRTIEDPSDLLTGAIPLKVEENVQGDFYVAVFIESKAVAYDGSYIEAGAYVIKLHYDTKNLVITYMIEARDGNQDVSDKMTNGEWVKGQIEVTIEVRKGDAEGDLDLGNYTFYYIGLDSISETYTEDQWIRVDEGQLVENTLDYNYRFTLTFPNVSFKKYIGVSVCNEAGYRSKQSAIHTNLIKVDNTTPSIDEIIKYNTDESASNNGTVVEGVRRDSVEKRPNGSTSYTLFTYYSTKDISLQKITKEDRSDITYKYAYLGQEDISADKLRQRAEDLTVLGTNGYEVFAGASVPVQSNSYEVVYYAIYAINGVDKEAEGGTAIGGTVEFTHIYRFVYDSGSLDGTLNYDNETGYNNPNTNMFSYMWKDNVSLYATAIGSAAPSTETEYIMFQFSVDDGDHWYNYNFSGLETWYGSGEDTALSFSPDLLRWYYDENGDCEFEYGVSKVFLFRARNKAGATHVYGNVYIAMENTTPEFTVATYVNDAEYNGGNIDLSRKPDKWANAPVIVEIEPTIVPASGITYTYYLEYNNGSSFVSTSPTKLTNTRFSTDTLDGFNLNKDALLTIEGCSNSSADRKFSVTVRIAVDQVVPGFDLTGIAFNKEASVTTQIASGDWTNKNSVSVSRSVQDGVNNVSQVTYTYYISTKETTSMEANWDDEIGSIDVTESCVITVTARTEAGVTYTKDFVVNIDTTPPIIEFAGGMNVIEGEEYFIDLYVMVREANIKICEYIVIKENTRGFNFAPEGYTLSTSSVDNSTRYDAKTGEEYRGFVRVYVEDYAGNTATIWFYVLPFKLTVNNITLSDEDLAQVDSYEDNLNKADAYMEPNRKSYFANLISRLRDRISTLQTEIAGYRQYLEDLSSITSFTLTDHYRTMYEFNETFHNYEVYGNGWIQTAITGDATSKYYAYYQRFLTEFGKLQALMNQVETVQEHVVALPAINMVQAKDYENILRVYDEYRNLTQDQREAFSTNLKNKLDDLKEDCEVLLLIDADLGVQINGDFAPGATINVTEYVENTDTYNKAQKVLYEQVSADEARTIVSIYRIELDNEFAQTSASDIVVTLPIEEEFRSYIYFSVYELSTDGSIKLVQDTEIQRDGASVKFSTDSLTTYVLCAKTELGKTDTSEGVYGSILGLELTAEMIKYLLYIGAALFGVVLLVVLITGIRHRRFLNSYNRAYRHSLYRKSVKGIPKGNKIK